MNAAVPHYLLISESSKDSEPGHWRFVLKSADGRSRLVADDVEPDVRGERLELLTVVRGLEALDQPSEVTIVTSSVYVRKGIEYGIAEWRENGWQWEFFGEMVPVKDNDLWQRLDRATQFHRIKCRTLRIDPPHAIQRPVMKHTAGRPSSRRDEGAAQGNTECTPPSGGFVERWRKALVACFAVIRDNGRRWRQRWTEVRSGCAPSFGLMRLF